MRNPNREQNSQASRGAYDIPDENLPTPPPRNRTAQPQPVCNVRALHNQFADEHRSVHNPSTSGYERVPEHTHYARLNDGNAPQPRITHNKIFELVLDTSH